MKRNGGYCIGCCILAAGILVGCSSANRRITQQSNSPSSGLSTEKEPDMISGISLENVTNFKVLADIGSIQVKQGNEYSITGENLVQEWISAETQSGTLIIRYQPPAPDDIKGMDISTHLLTITLPPEHSVEEAAFNAGNGNLTIENFSTDKLEVSQGSGGASLYNIAVDHLATECGTGNFNGSNVSVEMTSELHAGEGEITLTGDLSGSILVEGGTNSVTLNLVQPRENYIIRGESLVREIFLDGKQMENYSDTWEEWKYDVDIKGEKNPMEDQWKSADSNQHIIEIDGGVGTVSVNFAVTQ